MIIARGKPAKKVTKSGKRSGANKGKQSKAIKKRTSKPTTNGD